MSDTIIPSVSISLETALFSHCSVLKAEIIRPMSGLGIFKHNAVGVKGLAADDGKAVVVV